MKKALAFPFLFTLFSIVASAQAPINWTKDQLLQPSELAKTIAGKKDLPLIYSVGPGALIPSSTAIGMVKEEENMAGFKKQLAALPKNTAIVIYCGCCPFEHCPNVRPAISALKESGFTNYKLLDLPHNLKADWIDKGYPTTKQ